MIGPPTCSQRDFTASRPNERWVADFTYVATWPGIVYVAFVVDVFSRAVVGWSAATSKRAKLVRDVLDVLDALDMALWRRDRAGVGTPAGPGLVHHSAAGSHQDSVHDQHGVLAEPLALLEGERRPEVVDDAVGRGLRRPEQRRQLPQGQVGPPVRGDQQHTVLQRQAPRPALAHRICTLPPERGDQLVELARAQPAERGYPGRLRHRDHTSHVEIIAPQRAPPAGPRLSGTRGRPESRRRCGR
ncbi:hypothetical protein C1J00_34580 [Streptomyces cahuitamycinicus]|uniref:Integrase catalytic domain-containing protein n=1 Tax=Streptomyces cahuitamycinicus TaxID=2070367 RepID=A0A2N8TFL5_9ACTN|nr:hypothetical protein C1J00_34580 [Streptomyces cahuitamycinicus]